MKKAYITTYLILLLILLVSCGDSKPSFSHIIVKSDRQGILLDSKDSAILSTLQKIFYDKEQQPDAGPEFRFFIDITIAGETTRWQYSVAGYIRNYGKGHSMIYQLKDIAEFNRTANIH